MVCDVLRNWLPLLENDFNYSNWNSYFTSDMASVGVYKIKLKSQEGLEKWGGLSEDRKV